MNKNRKNGSIDFLKDHLERSFKGAFWLWVILAIFFMVFIIIIVTPGPEYDLGRIMILSSVLQIFFVLMMAVTFFYYLKFKETSKQVAFFNREKMKRRGIIAAVVMISFWIVIFTLYFLDVFPGHLNILFFLFVSQIAGWVVIYINNIRFRGSVNDWYNNIVVREGHEIQDLRNGYTGRPYTMKLFEPHEVMHLQESLMKYGEKMESNVIIAGYRFFEYGMILYIPSPTLYSGMMGIAQDLQQTTRLMIYNDGTMSVNISREDYERIGLDVTYHELCQRVLLAFTESIRAFINHEEEKAIEILGGKDYIKKRKKTLRRKGFTAVRIGAVLIVALSIFFIGLTPESLVTLDRDFTNYYPEYQYGLDEEISVDIYSYHFNRLTYRIDKEEPTKGDELLVTFSANTSVPRVFIKLSGGYPFIIISEVLTNVSSGEFRFTAEEETHYFLYFDLVDDTKNWNERVKPTTINVTVKHLNAYNPNSHLVALGLLTFCLPIEFLIWFRRQYLDYKKKIK